MDLQSKQYNYLKKIIKTETFLNIHKILQIVNNNKLDKI